MQFIWPYDKQKGECSQYWVGLDKMAWSVRKKRKCSLTAHPCHPARAGFVPLAQHGRAGPDLRWFIKTIHLLTQIYIMYTKAKRTTLRFLPIVDVHVPGVPSARLVPHVPTWSHQDPQAPKGSHSPNTPLQPRAMKITEGQGNRKRINYIKL